MPQSQKMVLDSNVFIEAKNRYYAFDICPGYWDFVIRVFGAGNAMSITHVWDEIQVGGDDLATWMEANLDKRKFFDCVKDADVVVQYRAVSSYVTTAYSTKPNAIHDFLEPTVADPWLAAYALACGGTIVTQETVKQSKRKVSLVDVCDHFGVRHIDVIEFLRAEKARFVLA
jgi:hypothetical protein